MKEHKAIQILIIFLMVLLSFLPYAINLLPPKYIKAISIPTFLLVLILLIFETYKDIREKIYTTKVLILISDVVIIAAFLILQYEIFTISGIANIMSKAIQYNFAIRIMILSFVGILIRNFLKSKKFETRSRV